MSIESELAESLHDEVRKFIYKKGATLAKIIGTIEVVKLEVVDKYKEETGSA